MADNTLKINYLDILQRHLPGADHDPKIDADHNGHVSNEEAQEFIRHNAHQLPKKMALDLFQARSAKRFKTEKLSPAEIKKWNEKLESEKIDDKRISIHDPNSPIQKYIEDPAVDSNFADLILLLHHVAKTEEYGDIKEAAGKFSRLKKQLATLTEEQKNLIALIAQFGKEGLQSPSDAAEVRAIGMLAAAQLPDNQKVMQWLQSGVSDQDPFVRYVAVHEKMRLAVEKHLHNQEPEGYSESLKRKIEGYGRAARDLVVQKIEWMHLPEPLRQKALDNLKELTIEFGYDLEFAAIYRNGIITVDLTYIDEDKDVTDIFDTLVHELFHQAFLGKEIAEVKNGQEHFLAEITAEILTQETLLELAGIDPSFQIQPKEQSQHPGDLFKVTSVMENISSGYAIYLLNDEIQEFIVRVGMKKIIAAMMTGDTTELNQSLREHYGLTIEELLPNDERYTRKGFARQLLLSRDFSERIWKSKKMASN